MVIDTAALLKKLSDENDVWKAANPTYKFGNDEYIKKWNLINSFEKLATENGMGS